MATRKTDFPGLFTVTAKGKRYNYAWRNGPRILSKEGTPDFAAEFKELTDPHANLDRGKFGAWVPLYRAHPHKEMCGGKMPYCALSKSTRKNWDPLLDDAQKHFGSLSVRFLDRPSFKKDIWAWRRKWAGKPRMADLAAQVLSRVCSFMVAQGAIATNPCSKLGTLYEGDRSEIIWTDPDLALLCSTASPEVVWAARLGALTGLRQGDCLRLKWANVSDLAIEIVTGKGRGKRKALIPITAELRALLAEIPQRAETVLTNRHGKSWKTGFGSSWQKALVRAGLGSRDLHFHDLRGTAATKLYRAGLTSREIADILGWSPKQVERLLDIYVKRDELLRDRIRKIEQAENENRKTDSKTAPPTDEKSALSA